MTHTVDRESGAALSGKIIVVGAGIGGLAAALDLAKCGADVTVLERAATVGGKMRELVVDGTPIDAGPTVLTMRWIFDEMFADAGASLDAHVTLRPAEILARHAWSETERLDLFADRERSVDAIAAFADRREAEGYRAFAERAQRMFETLDKPFIRAQRPRLDQLVASFGLFGLGSLRQISPFNILWKALGEYFRDPRLRQLFGRYATYCGSSPFLAPATLMLVAHVERAGVWYVEGGMHALPVAMAKLAASMGVSFRYGAQVASIDSAYGAIAGVTLATGERLAADAIVLNADVGALTSGLFGDGLKKAAPKSSRTDRSLSAVTFAMRAKTSGFPLVRHNVFFSRDYQGEFDTIMRHDRIPDAPTVYVCAQDRGDADSLHDKPERLLCLVNAPPSGDARAFSQQEISRCEDTMHALLAVNGLTIERSARIVTDPTGFEALFPATGGALYGPASHGWQASFNRAGARSKVPGLYLAGGSVHPGPGVPMAAMSGRLAAAACMADLRVRSPASTSRSARTATRGGTSTR